MPHDKLLSMRGRESGGAVFCTFSGPSTRRAPGATGKPRIFRRRAAATAARTASRINFPQPVDEPAGAHEDRDLWNHAYQTAETGRMSERDVESNI